MRPPSHEIDAISPTVCGGDGAEHPCRAQGACVHEQMADMPPPKRHDMVEALASDRSDEPFNMTVLPRRT